MYPTGQHSMSLYDDYSPGAQINNFINYTYNKEGPV